MTDDNIGGRQLTGEFNQQINDIAKRNRLNTLTLQQTDLTNDQFLFKNQYGVLECKICCTHHKSEASYLAHINGKTHQRNLERRRAITARREAQMAGTRIGPAPIPEARTIKQQTIGEPAYSVFKRKDPVLNKLTILFEITYDKIQKHTDPKFRIVSTYEQKVEPPDPKYQYILFAAQPYTTIAFKVPNRHILTDETIEDWKPTDHKYTVQISLISEPV